MAQPRFPAIRFIFVPYLISLCNDVAKLTLASLRILKLVRMQTETKNFQTKASCATFAYALVLFGFWQQVERPFFIHAIGGHVPSAFACFALLLAPIWFFGFGAGDLLRERLTSRIARLSFPVLLAFPYFIFAVPRGEFQWRYALAFALIPVVISALFEFSRLKQKFAWQDAVVLLFLALVLELRLLSGAWQYPGLGSLPKLYLADVALYAYIVVRGLERVGYSFIPSLSAFTIGLREWAFFAPIGIGLGLALQFIHFIPRQPSLLSVFISLIATFLFTAVPEELFFRGILQNLLEPRLGPLKSLLVASALFGLSHFHKGAMFNWRYVLLAFLAGIFYGRAWRSRRQLLASSTTHTLVDVVWSLWFR
jgi:hypothetical protein